MIKNEDLKSNPTYICLRGDDDDRKKIYSIYDDAVKFLKMEDSYSSSSVIVYEDKTNYFCVGIVEKCDEEEQKMCIGTSYVLRVYTQETMGGNDISCAGNCHFVVYSPKTLKKCYNEVIKGSTIASPNVLKLYQNMQDKRKSGVDIENVYVKRRFNGKGIGGMMVAQVISFVKEMGIADIVLEAYGPALSYIQESSSSGEIKKHYEDLVRMYSTYGMELCEYNKQHNDRPRGVMLFNKNAKRREYIPFAIDGRQTWSTEIFEEFVEKNNEID